SGWGGAPDKPVSRYTASSATGRKEHAMAQQFPSLNDRLIKFIARQHLYFVGTAAATGRVNVSPKGGDTLRVLGPNLLVWLNLTGSGNESAGHLLENNRMTVMF